MTCDHPDCNGVHSTARRPSELCPRAQYLRTISRRRADVRHYWRVRKWKRLRAQRERVTEQLRRLEEGQ